MAWGLRYTYTGCTEDGTPQVIRVLEEDYTGPVTEIDAGPVPFLIAYESATGNKFDPIRPSTATVTLVGNESFDLEFIWTTDERKYRIERYLDGGLNWRGYIIPDGFRHNFTGEVYYATITASDGLSTLANMPFLTENGELYNLVDLTYNNGSRYPIVLIVTEILRKLDLDLNLWTCVGIYESRKPRTGGREADPLAYTTVDVRTYINDTQRDDIPYWQDVGATWDCARVLRNALTLWGAKLYQEGGSWKLKYINDDAATTPRQWRKYNTAAVYIGQEDVNENVVIPCGYNTLVNGGHTMAMDRVFSQVRVNYKYTFLREGDTPENLIRNGNFVWNPAFLSPPEWKQPYTGVRLEVNRAVGTAPCAPTGICTAIDVLGQQNVGAPTIHAWLSSDEIDISQGDNIMLQWWQRVPRIGSTGTFGLYAILCRGASNDPSTHYWLVNDGASRDDGSLGKWVQSSSAIYYRGTSGGRVADLVANDYWQLIKIKVPPAPVSGELIISIMGLGSNSWAYTEPSSLMQDTTFAVYAPSRGSGTIEYEPAKAYSVRNSLAFLTVTGFFAGLIKNVSSEEVPKIHGYLYPEVPRPEYTDRNEPIEIFNGDEVDVDHVSSIQVDGVSGKLFWDTWDDKYGYSSLGLLLARSIAEQYWTPNRILEGDFMNKDITFSSRVSLVFLPGVRFILQRGAWDVKRNMWRATTLIQVSDVDIPEGGSDGGNTIDPIWEDTGLTECVKQGGVNTGEVVKQEQDINPASNSYGQLQWVPAGTDIVKCPIGEPTEYLWGTQPAVYDADNFQSVPFLNNPDGSVTVRYTSAPPGGRYMFFLHLSSLGLVNSVKDIRNAETISDWQYLADQVIDGHNYKVMRMNYPTGHYNEIPMTFAFI